MNMDFGHSLLPRRTAVPVLMEALKERNLELQVSAAFGLQELRCVRFRLQSKFP